ncbi:MAG: 16S rRNA (uracil(1498)-N(3))-methyltransferase [Candidatus Omnitrophica bacterium]|jgi:16S rRNA (uracil1498-N3)-methyltransferase|nr:16S rRNA (uracil(1498)-N(3))-methyltransferase [Candidatus Omnitrophota bacterium]
MRRFFCPSENIRNNKICISDKDTLHHIKDVLRMKPKDEAVIFSEKSDEFKACLESVDEEKAQFFIKQALMPSKEQLLKITVCCAIPKKAKMDEIVDKLTQLGVEKIIPLASDHVIGRMDKQRQKEKVARWQRIAKSASLQSQRNIIPVVEEIKTVDEALKENNAFDLKVIANLANRPKFLKDVFSPDKHKRILVFIGPEGDFSAREINLALENSCVAVSLGETTLRVDTAAIAVVSYIKLSNAC